MLSQTCLRRFRHLAVFLALIFLSTHTFSTYFTYAHAQTHDSSGTCQGASKGSCFWLGKSQSLPALPILHQLPGDVSIERFALPQEESPPSRESWQPFFSRSPPQA